MPEEARRLRVVGSNERGRPRRPGPAVVSILLYALLFGGALWYLRAKSPLFQKTRPTGEKQKSVVDPGPGDETAAGKAPTRDSRQALLSGEKVAQAARAAYFQRLATQRCDCGCERTLSDCLANERSCSRSPALAGKLVHDSRFKARD